MIYRSGSVITAVITLKPMQKPFFNLLRYTASNVTLECIQSYTTTDPGYYRYVEQLDRVRTTLEVPYPVDFDLAEPIRFAAWIDSGRHACPDGVRAFRRFATSIVLHPMAMDAENGLSPIEKFHGSHFLAHNLLVDVSTNDREHLALMRSAMSAARNVLVAPIQAELPDFQFIDDGCVYFTFGMLFLSQLAGDWISSEACATQLILDVHEGDIENGEMVDYPTADVFTNPNVRKNWNELIQCLRNPTDHPDTTTVIENLARRGNA